MFDNEIDKYRTYQIYDLDRGLGQATIRNMLKEEGKDFQEYLKYLDENGIKYQ